MSLARISVIIVSYNAPCFLEVCLDSVKASLQGLDGEIIIVDNASREGCVEMVRGRFPDVELLVNEENVGFSRAVNQGVRKATGEYILILNPDSVLPEDGLEKVLDFAVSQKELGAVGCRFIDGTGALLPECKRNLPGIGSALLKLMGLNFGYYADQLEERETGEVEVLTGAFMFMRRDLFEEMKGFDEDYFMFGEDIDLSFRIRNAGYRNYYLGQVSIIHFKGESSVKDLRYLRNFYGALEIYYQKHFRTHRLGRSVLRALVRTAVGFRMGKASSRATLRQSPESFTYLGQRQQIYEGLRERMEGLRPRFVRDREGWEPEPEDFLLFDGESLTFSEIISHIDSAPAQARKRIIGSSGQFFIGSDDPAHPGICRSIP